MLEYQPPFFKEKNDKVSKKRLWKNGSKRKNWKFVFLNIFEKHIWRKISVKKKEKNYFSDKKWGGFFDQKHKTENKNKKAEYIEEKRRWTLRNQLMYDISLFILQFQSSSQLKMMPFWYFYLHKIINLYNRIS